jgi:drug/metabolite transporter (DMT)-like permease
MIIYLKLLLTAFFWGGTFIAGRVIAGHVGPFSAAFLRFSIASVFLGIFVWRTKGNFSRLTLKQWVSVVCLGMTGVFAYNVFFFKGLSFVEAGRAAVIIATTPALIGLFSVLIFKERLAWLNGTGILLSISGAIIVISRGSLDLMWQGGLGNGELYIFGCVCSWVMFSLIGKTVMTSISPLVAIFYASFIGAVALLLPALLEGLFNQIPTYLIIDWCSLFYLGFFGTVIGFVWYYQGIQAIGPTRAGLFINFVPVSAVLSAFLILDEPLTISLLSGTLLVFTGTYLANRPTV